MGIKLLLADDSITIQKVVGIIFAGDEFELTVVDNGNAALDKAKESLPDIVLVDAMMPGKNGYEVCQAIRQDPALQHLPLLLLTGAFEPFDEAKARQCGADAFITKPFESQQLMESVKGLLASTGERQSVGAVESEIPVEEPAVSEVEDWATMTAPDLAPLPEAAPLESEATMVSFDAFATALEAAPVAAEPAVTPAPADDLWGAFEMEEVPAAEAGGDVQDLTPNQYVSGGDDFASALAAQPTGAADIVGDWGAAPVAEAEPLEQTIVAEEPASTFAMEPVGEVIGFSEEAFTVEPVVEPEPASSESVVAEAEFVAPVTEAPAFEAPAFIPPVVEAPVFETTAFIPPVAEPEFVQGSEPAAVEPAAAASAVPTAAPAGSVTLSDEQLSDLVARISRDVIERIVWEVVPDLAETIIKEEIRKIKEGR